ncbi:MAG TPA: SRPBCC domain-containing protein [Acidimicrobiales bacterium]|nr:SRPBCC domain-containing protein [Acidimicrobiales bacterium]
MPNRWWGHGRERRVPYEGPGRGRARPEKVFAARTTLGGLAGWWTPAVAGSAERGGEVTLGFGDERVVLRVEEALPASRVVWRCLEHARFPEWDGTRLSFDLAPQDAATLVGFEHAGLVPALDCYPDCSAGWAHYLGSLAALVTTGRGMPWRTPGWQAAREASD